MELTVLLLVKFFSSYYCNINFLFIIPPPVFWQQPAQIRINGGTAIKQLDVYPNPSRDVFNISFVSEKLQTLKIRVLNILGEEIYIEEREEYVGEYTKQINLDNYRKGVYLLDIETFGVIINKKLILQ